MIRIILADDHKLFIDGVYSILSLESDIDITGVAHNGEQVLDLLKKNSAVDIIVLDVEMPGVDGIEVTREVRREYPNIKILITSMYNKTSFILELMKLGVSGYILKDKSKDELLSAIHNVYRNQPHFSLEVLSIFSHSRNNPLSEKVQLTEREEEVLVLVAEGLKTKDIAKKLFISTETVSVHRKNLKRKTGLENASQIIRYAIRHGYIDV